MHTWINKHLIANRLRIRVLIAVGAVALVNLLAYSYLKTENTVYYWDISAYWKNGIDLLTAFHTSFADGMALLGKSLSSDYNYLPLLPILPVMHLLGSSRGIFVAAILNLYIVPFALITAYSLARFFEFENQTKKTLFYAITLPILLFFPAVLIPVFDGRVDGIGLVMMSLVFLLYVRTRFSRYWHYILLGVLLCLMLVFRRYYSYWALGFFLSLALLSFLDAWRRSGHSLNKGFFLILLRHLLGLLIAGLTILVILLTGFHDMFMRYIGQNYVDTYSAYRLGGFGDQLLLFVRNFGLVAILLAAAGYFVSFRAGRRSKTLPFSSFILLQSIIVYLTFTYTQSFGVHHYYMLTPLFLWGFILLVKYLLDRKYSYGALAVPAVIAVLALMTFTGERSLQVDTLEQSVFGLTQNARPTVRHDMDTLHDLSNYMATVMKPGEYVYIVSSSDIFNDDIFRDITLPSPPPVNVSGTAHIDKRDGFPNYFFDAQYVMVADPIQTHVEPSGQRVITELASRILKGEANNLVEIKSFVIENGVRIRIFKKEGPYSSEFIRGLHDFFRQQYPTYPKLNNIHLDM